MYVPHITTNDRHHERSWRWRSTKNVHDVDVLISPNSVHHHHHRQYGQWSSSSTSSTPKRSLAYTNVVNLELFDAYGRHKFTHAADFQARIVVQNALFALGPFGRKRVSELVIPWATYTSPEIAHVGMYEQDAKQTGIKIDTWQQPFQHIDRAILDGSDAGFAKVFTKRGTDRIVGATIVANNAGDLISEVVVAMTNGIGLAGIGASAHPYPTTADAIRRLGDQYRRTRLTPINQKVLNLLRRLNVGR